jgi:hypothetical protein
MTVGVEVVLDSELAMTWETFLGGGQIFENK